MNIFKLFGSVFVDTEKADKSLQKTDKNAESLGKKFVKGAKTVGKFGAVLGGVALAGSTAVFKMAEKTAEATDRIDKMSQRLGLSREGFQEWEFVMSQAGVSIDQMQGGMKTLTQRMQESVEGVGIGSEAFEKLGITITDSMSQEEAFNTTITALQNMEDGVEKAALAQELFGRQGQELLPLLNSTAESTEELKNKAQELGLVMGDDAIDSGVQFTDTMDQLKRSFGQAFVSIGAQFLPMVQKFAAWVVDNMPEIQAFFQTAFEVISASVSFAVEWFDEHLLPILLDVFEWVKMHMPEIKQFFKDAFEFSAMVIQATVLVFEQYLIPILVAVFTWTRDHMPEIKAFFETAFEGIKAVVLLLWDIFENVFLPILKVIFNFIVDNWPTIQKVFETVFDGIKAVVDKFIENTNIMMEVLGIVYDFIAGTFQSTGDLIISAFDGVSNFLDGIVEKFNKVKDSVVGAINKFKEFVGLEKGGETSTPVSALSSVNLSNIRGLAQGGSTMTPGVVRVGERGPEDIFLPKAATVKPLQAGMSGGVSITLSNNVLLGDDDVTADKIGTVVVDRLRELGVITVG